MATTTTLMKRAVCLTARGLTNSTTSKHTHIFYNFGKNSPYRVMDLTAMNLIAPAVLKCAWFGPRYFVCGRENELTTLCMYTASGNTLASSAE